MSGRVPFRMMVCAAGVGGGARVSRKVDVLEQMTLVEKVAFGADITSGRRQSIKRQGWHVAKSRTGASEQTSDSIEVKNGEG